MQAILIILLIPNIVFMHYLGHQETKAISLVQSSEQRKVCLNKAQISKLLRAYQWMTNHNLKTALSFTSIKSVGIQAGLLFLLVRQAAR